MVLSIMARSVGTTEPTAPSINDREPMSSTDGDGQGDNAEAGQCIHRYQRDVLTMRIQLTGERMT